MKRRTSTTRISAALPMIDILKAEVYDKSSYEKSAIDPNVIIENIQFLAESGVFTDCLGWTFEINCNSNGEYIIETGRMNMECNLVLTILVKVKNNLNIDEVEKGLLIAEE